MDIELREATRDYIDSPGEETANRLVRLLLRGGYGKECEEASIVRIGPNRIWVRIRGIEICFSGSTSFLLTPVAYYDINKDELLSVVENSIQNLNFRATRSIREFEASCSPISSGKISEYDLNWAISETYECRLGNLLKCYQKHPSNTIADLVLKTYIQSQQPAHGIPMSAELGIKGSSLANACSINLGSIKVLISYNSPVAFIDNGTKECFYTCNRTQTSANHIGKFFRANNVSGERWQKNCIELPQCVFNAMFS